MSSETHSREILVCPAHPYFLPSSHRFNTNGSIGEEAVPNYDLADYRGSIDAAPPATKLRR